MFAELEDPVERKQKYHRQMGILGRGGSWNRMHQGNDIIKKHIEDVSENEHNPRQKRGPKNPKILPKAKKGSEKFKKSP